MMEPEKKENVLGFAIDGDGFSEHCSICAIGEPGPGGNHHHFDIFLPTDVVRIDFQKGNPMEEINGITDEMLLAILLHRFTALEKGPFGVHETQMAKIHVASALEACLERKRQRMDRGVLGQMVK